MQKIACEPQVGADPEVFLADVNDNIVPCVGIFKGTKAKPWTPPGYEGGYMMQEDNVMCEFNVPTAFSKRDGYYIMQHAKKMVIGQAKLHNLTPKWGVSDHKFKPTQLRSKQAQAIGCESDNDAYTGGGARSILPDLTQWRSCGGHIHLGGDFKCPDFVAALFAELFIAIAGQCSGVRHEGARAKWYGQPGIYRSKTYGIEYRSPSNRWITSNISIERTYSWAYMCAKWLTETDSLVIQKAFRALPWTELRAIMLNNKGCPTRASFLTKARKVGVPV